MQTSFVIDGLHYRVEVGPVGQVSLWLEAGVTRRGCLIGHPLWPDDMETVEDVGLFVGNPLRVFNRVVEIVVAWAAVERPHQVCFSPTNARRRRIYRWLVARHRRRLPGYWFYELGGTFYFFRDAASGNSASRIAGLTMS